MSKCDCCPAYNARVVYSYDGDKHQLCYKCLRILDELDETYDEVIREQTDTSLPGIDSINNT
jgi:hypothetical protein